MAKEKVLLSRGAVVAKSGVWSPDLVLVAFMCGRCSRFLDERAERVVTTVDAKDLDGLIAAAHKHAAQDVAVGAVPACTNCEVPGKAVSIDYHTYHAGQERDLVIRCFKKKGLFGKGRQELLWCDPRTTETVPAEMDDVQRGQVARDTLLRAARTAGEENRPELMTLAQKAFDSFGGDPLLLELIEVLNKAGQFELSERIALAHVAARPKDAGGHACLGVTVLDQLKAGRVPASHIDEAEEHIMNALKHEPSHLRSLLARGLMLRMRGDRPAARMALSDLVARHPSCAPALNELALLELEDQPETALTHFAQAEALEPHNIEPVIGSIRAGLRLGRQHDAKAALERAKKIDPRHASLEVLESKVNISAALPAAVSVTPPRASFIGMGSGEFSVPMAAAPAAVRAESSAPVVTPAPAPAPVVVAPPPVVVPVVAARPIPVVDDFADNGNDTVPDAHARFALGESDEDSMDAQA